MHLPCRLDQMIATFTGACSLLPELPPPPVLIMDRAWLGSKRYTFLSRVFDSTGVSSIPCKLGVDLGRRRLLLRMSMMAVEKCFNLPYAYILKEAHEGKRHREG